MRVGQTTNELVYHLRESHSQPSVDCSKCVKDVLLSPDWLVRFNRAIHKSRRVISVVYPLSQLPGWACTFVDASTGRVMGYLVLLLQSWSLLVISLMLRYDMVRILAGTYEFWYLTLLNAITNALACAKYSDARMIVPLFAFVGYENVLLADANIRGAQNLVVLSVVSGVVLLSYALYIALDLIDETRSIVLFSRGSWFVEARDLVANGMLTIIVMLLRNAFRKHQQIKSAVGRDTSVVRCISYRCRVRLIEVETESGGGNRVQQVVTPSPTHATIRVRSQLRLALPEQVFPSHHVVSSRVWRYTQLRAKSARLLYGLFTCGAAAASISACVQPDTVPLNVIALVLSVSHLTFSVSVCQRQLLRKLLSSFDVAYISGQFTLMLLSISYLQNWDHRCLSMLDCWLWIHWVLLFDAITPNTKRTLGIQHCLAIAVVGLLIFGQLLIALDLIFLERLGLKDRILFTIRAGPHSLPFSVASFMLSRIFSIFWWCWRLLWRLVTKTENELILIQEAVEYNSVMRSQRLLVIKPVTAIVPS